MWRVLRWLLLVAFGTFFAIPLLALLNFSTKDPITKERTAAAWKALFQDPTMTRRDHHLAAAGPVHGGGHGRAARADDGLGAPASTRRDAADRVPLPAAAHHPRAGDRGRPEERLRLGQLPRRRLGAHARVRLRRAGAAVRLPSDRLVPVLARRDDARRGGALAGRELVHRHRPRGRAQPLARRAGCGVHQRRAGAGGVHHRVADALQHAARGDRPDQQEQRPESMAAALASLLFAGLLLAALSLLDRRRSTTPEGS